MLNLATQFYTFRHTAVLNSFQEPDSYTDENFGDINDNNGYVIDPYFFKKTVENAGDFTNADGFFAQALVQLDINETVFGYAWNFSCTVSYGINCIQKSLLCADISCDCFSVSYGKDVISSRIYSDFVGGVLYVLTARNCPVDVLQFLLIFERFCGRVK